MVPTRTTANTASLSGLFSFFNAQGKKTTAPMITDQKEAFGLALKALDSGNTGIGQFLLGIASLDNTNFKKIADLQATAVPGQAAGIAIEDLFALAQKDSAGEGLAINTNDFTAAGVTTVSKTYTRDEVITASGGTVPETNTSDLLKLLLPLLLSGGGANGGGGVLLLLLLLSGKLGNPAA